MKQNKPFSDLTPVICPQDLENRICTRIRGLERRRDSINAYVRSVSAFVSFLTFIISSVYAWNVALSSGLGDYISIIFSDGGAVMASSKDFILVIVEALPFLGIGLALLALIAFVWSLSGSIKNNQSYEFAY